MVVVVKVVYCGGWGYGSKFRKFKQELEDDYSKDISVEGESTPGITGYFEVTVGDDLVHSKKNGDGFVDSEEKLKKITNAIDAKLK